MSGQDSPAWTVRHLRFLLLLGAVFLVGALLRVFELKQQIIIDDEIHGLHVALSRTVQQILTGYQVVDVSIPLVALSRLWLDLGHPLSEMMLRLPSLLTGLLALVLVPWYLRERTPALSLFLLSALLALFPLLVFYSRSARPYMVVTLCVFLALMAYRRFILGGAWFHGLAYVLLGAASTYLFFLAAPAILAAPLFGMLFDPATGRFAPQRLRSVRCWLPLAGVVMLTACLLFPLLDDLLNVSRYHVALSPGATQESNSFRTLAHIFLEGTTIVSGSHNDLVAVLFWLAVLRGAWLQRSTDPGLQRFFLIVVLLHFLAMTASLQLRLSHMFPVAFARYLLVLLPILCLWAALGMLTPFRPAGGKTRKRVQGVAVALWVASWLFTGPYAKLAATGFSTSFAGSKQLLAREPDPKDVMRGEAFYQALAREPGHSPVLESPGDEHDRIMQIYRGNQAIHRRPVLVTEYYWLGFDMSKLDFANMVALDMKAFLGSSADHLVVHRDLYGEYEERYGSIPAQLRNRAEPTRRQARTVTEGLTQTWGPPDYSDDAISVWNLRRVRRAAF